MNRLLIAALLSGCAVAPVKPVDPVVVIAPVDVHAEQRAVVDAFLIAVDARNFGDVHALLSKSLRDRYDAQRLQRDFENEPKAMARVEAVRLARKADFTMNGSVLPLHHDRQLRLVREDEQWKIASLE